MIFNLFATVFISATLMCDTLNNNIKDKVIDNSNSVLNVDNDYFISRDSGDEFSSYSYVSNTETYELTLFTNFLNELDDSDSEYYVSLYIYGVLSEQIAIHFDKVILNSGGVYDFYRSDNLVYSFNIVIMPFQFVNDEVITMIVHRGFLLFSSNSAKLFSFIYWDGDWVNKSEYYLPPYITINKDAISFIYNVGFTFEGSRYYGIEYKYHEYYRFLGDTNYDFDMSISTDGNDYVFVYRHLYDDNIFDMYNHIPTITLTCYGYLGLQYLNEQYINVNDNYLTGKYYLRVNSLVGSFINDTKWGESVEVIFSSNNEFFSSLSVLKFTASNGYRIAVHYQNSVKSITVYDRTMNINTGETTEHLENDMSDFYAINLNRVPYDLNLYKMLRVAYAVDEVEGYFNGYVDNYTSNGDLWGLLGNAFTSLGGIFGLMIFPGVSLGLLLSLPIFGLVLMFIIGLFKR